MPNTKKRKYTIKVLSNNTYGVVMSCMSLQLGSMSQVINQKGTNMPSIPKVLINIYESMIIYCDVSYHCKHLKGML